MRKCTICKTFKPLNAEEFVKNNCIKGGIGYTCRACQKVINEKKLEKVYCEPCHRYITKLHFKNHTKTKMHELLLRKQKTKLEISRVVRVC